MVCPIDRVGAMTLRAVSHRPLSDCHPASRTLPVPARYPATSAPGTASQSRRTTQASGRRGNRRVARRFAGVVSAWNLPATGRSANYRFGSGGIRGSPGSRGARELTDRFGFASAYGSDWWSSSVSSSGFHRHSPDLYCLSKSYHQPGTGPCCGQTPAAALCRAEMGRCWRSNAAIIVRLSALG